MSVARLFLSAVVFLAALAILHPYPACAGEPGAAATTRIALAFRNVGDGQPAKPFTLKDTSGKDTSLSEASGKVVVLLFFKPDQKNSQEALSDLQKLHDKYAPKGVSFIAVMSEPGGEAALPELLTKLKITYPVLIDMNRKVYGDWGVFLYPTTGVIDKSGNLSAQFPSYNWKYADSVEGQVRFALGEINKEQLENILNPKAVAQATPERKKAERHMLLAEKMVERKLMDKAGAELAEAVQADPTYAEARVKYGFLLLKTGDAQKAKENFAKAIEINPKAEDAATGIGASMVALGEVDKGIEQLEGALKLNPKPARTHFELGKAYEKKGACDKAVEHYRKALEELGGSAW
jgi:tetratricopeptide (TPR) repeat protein